MNFESLVKMVALQIVMDNLVAEQKPIPQSILTFNPFVSPGQDTDTLEPEINEVSIYRNSNPDNWMDIDLPGTLGFGCVDQDGAAPDEPFDPFFVEFQSWEADSGQTPIQSISSNSLAASLASFKQQDEQRLRDLEQKTQQKSYTKEEVAHRREQIKQIRAAKRMKDQAQGKILRSKVPSRSLHAQQRPRIGGRFVSASVASSSNQSALFSGHRFSCENESESTKPLKQAKNKR